MCGAIRRLSTASIPRAWEDEPKRRYWKDTIARQYLSCGRTSGAALQRYYLPNPFENNPKDTNMLAWSPSTYFAHSERVRRVEQFVGQSVPSSVDLPENQQKYLLKFVARMQDPTHAQNMDYREEMYLKATVMQLIVQLSRDYELRVCAQIQDAIEFWSDRLQVPWLAWVEAGPWEWHKTFEKEQPATGEAVVATVLHSKADTSSKINQRIKNLETILTNKLRHIGVAQGLISELEMCDRKSPNYETWLRRCGYVLGDVYGLRIGKETPSTKDLAAITPSLLHGLQEFHKQELINFRARELLVPSRTRRNWYLWVIAIPTTLVLANWSIKNAPRVFKMIAQAEKSAMAFIEEHINEPARAILAELMVERKKLTDASALKDAEESLKNMLDSFIQDTEPNMPAEQRLDMVQRMDMSVISSQYERSLRHTIKNFVTGDIVRMLLIQVQYIKADLLSTMSAVENLIDANEFNFRLTATLPALFALWAVTNGVRSLVNLARRESSREDTFGALRVLLTSMERLLNLRNLPAEIRNEMYETLPLDLPLEGSLQIEPSAGTPQLLGALDKGALLLLVYRFRAILWRFPRRFSHHDVMELKEDLSELVGERGYLTVGQQLNILMRMRASYSFLRVKPSGLLGIQR